MKKSTSNKCQSVEKREPPLHCGWECKVVQLLLRTVWEFLKKLKTKLPYDPAILLLLHRSGENANLKKYKHLTVHSSTIYNSQDMQTT